MSLVRSFSEHQLIALQDDEWLERQRVAGRSTVFCLNSARHMINSRSDLNVIGLRSHLILLMKTFGCTQVKNNPSSIEIRVNEDLIHTRDDSYYFQEGDMVRVTMASMYKEAIAKSAATFIKGNPKSLKHLEMLKVCHAALNNAINQIQIGKRIGCIGHGINFIAKKSNFKLMSEFGGCGIDTVNPKTDPFISNKSQPNVGVRIYPGMTFTISPSLMLNYNKSKDLNCNFEKTVFIHQDGVEIITPWEWSN